MLCAQVANVAAPERFLTVAETQEVSGTFTNPIFPAKCGLDGTSIYFRQFTGESSMPPTRLDADRKSAKTFGLDATRYFHHAQIWDFAPASYGGVYLLIWFHFQDGDKLNKGYRVLSFNGDGRLTKDILLEGLTFDPLHMAAFSNGSFVVAGRKTSERGGHRGAPGIALISETGRVLKTLTIEHDVVPPEAGAAKMSTAVKNHKPDMTEQSEKEKAQQQYDSSLDFSLVQSGDDGNIYVLRYSHGGPLFQITPAGIVREIMLPDYQGSKVNAAMVARGHVLVHYVHEEEFGQSDLGLYSEYDLATMEKIRDFSVEKIAPISNAMQGCYSGDQITFLKIRPHGHLFVLVAKMQ
jgi:hypothetical protein